MGRAVSFQRPNLHLAEALSAELRLAAEWLLRNQRVWPNRSRVNLVVHEVRQFQHVDIADGHLLFERVAAQSVVENRLA